MRQLEAMANEAIALANGDTPTGAVADAARQMQICNACRYCEGFCAVFPAMTRRLAFAPADMHYLANLCHNCGACLHACQYAPPHEFAVNVPQAMAKVRRETYAAYAWPASLGALYRTNGLVLALATALGIGAFLWLLAAIGGGARAVPGGNFYAVFPHNLLVAIFGTAFGWAVLALGIGGARFWRGNSPGALQPGAGGDTLKNVLALTYLDGGHGDGCNESSDRFTLVRRRFHHLTFYGFLFCFASTTIATIYHYAFGWHAPYPFLSIPVVLGTVGGIGLLIGPTGLLWLNLRRAPGHGDAAQRPMDRAFIALLLLASASGIALLAWRESASMPALLALHLGAVIALFLTLPYGKFAHAIYRTAALLKYNTERRQPSALQLGAD
jgi:citrate/tricarballylate utilization protein